MLKKSGQILRSIIQKLQRQVRPGVSTMEIDILAGKLIKEKRSVSAFLGFNGYPANICTSVNEEIVHGIPGGRILKEGDIISLDVGINYKGYFTDAAVTVPVGRVHPKLKELMKVTENSLSEGIKQARPNNHLSDISYAIQSYVEDRGYSVVRQFVGHGVGFSLHEEPQIPNFGAPHEGELLKEGMVFAIEPMVNIGTGDCKFLDNGWTAVTKDGFASAHFEHTVAITEKGPRVLTN